MSGYEVQKKTILRFSKHLSKGSSYILGFSLIDTLITAAWGLMHKQEGRKLCLTAGGKRPVGQRQHCPYLIVYWFGWMHFILTLAGKQQLAICYKLVADVISILCHGQHV